jgi:hypothetical protein
MKTRFRVTLTVEADPAYDEDDMLNHVCDGLRQDHPRAPRVTDIEVEREPEEPSLSVEARQ